MQRLLIILAGLTLLFSCGTISNTSISNQNSAFLYNKESSLFHPSFTVFHFSDDSTRIYYNFTANELLASNKETGQFNIAYRLSYHLYNSLDEAKLIDSTSLPIAVQPALGAVSNSFTIGSAKIITAVLVVKITDLYRKKAFTFYVNIDRSSKQGRQFFKVKTFNPHGDSLGIAYYNNNISSLTSDFYHRNFGIADPPFALDRNESFDYKPDSVFGVNLNDPVNLKKEGFYHLQINKDDKAGLTLYRFYDNFPSINSAQQLLEPLRYLTSQKEYDALSKNANPKNAIDDFWLELGGDDVRSRELLKKYYTRVIDANKIFTSYKEGWKTDRGMIYIIYGIPNIVYKTTNSESWIYGEENNTRSLSFTFIRVNNPFTDNDFTLSRTPIYLNNWNSAIEVWRNGRAYNDTY